MERNRDKPVADRSVWNDR